MPRRGRPLTAVCLLVGERVYPCLIHGESGSFGRERRCTGPEGSRETAGEMRAAAVTEQLTATKADLVLTSPKISDGGGR